MEDAHDFWDNLDELEITNRRGETKPLEDNSKRRLLNQAALGQEVSREGYYKGTGLDTTTVFRIVREAAKRAAVPNWDEVSPHWLHHCHGSHAIDHQAPLTVVRDTLDHSNISVTNEYAKARPDQSSAGYLPLSRESRTRENMNMQSTENEGRFPRPLQLLAAPYLAEDPLSIPRRSGSRMGYPDDRTVLFPSHSHDDIQDRWSRLLEWSWRFIVPDWLLRAFEGHEY